MPTYRRTPRWPIWVAALIVILLVAAGVVTLLKVRHNTTGSDPARGGGNPAATHSAGPAPKPPAGSSAPAALVTVDPADYVDLDVDVVVQRLQRLGLRTRALRTAEVSGRAPGTVVAITPSGPLPVGSVIIVYATPKGRGGNR